MPGSTPQPGKNPSGNPTYNSETAIWSYNAASFEVTAQWITGSGSPLTFLMYDPSAAMFFITLNPASAMETRGSAYLVVSSNSTSTILTCSFMFLAEILLQL